MRVWKGLEGYCREDVIQEWKLAAGGMEGGKGGKRGKGDTCNDEHKDLYEVSRGTSALVLGIPSPTYAGASTDCSSSSEFVTSPSRHILIDHQTPPPPLNKTYFDHGQSTAAAGHGGGRGHERLGGGQEGDGEYGNHAHCSCCGNVGRGLCGGWLERGARRLVRIVSGSQKLECHRFTTENAQIFPCTSCPSGRESVPSRDWTQTPRQGHDHIAPESS